MDLSSVILTRNNEDSIINVLESVAFCDEIVVIDDNSTDATPAIAQKFGAVVYTRSLNHDFAAQRNYGLSKVHDTWVLFIDSDESVSFELQKEILEAIQKVDVNGFFLKRQDVMWGGPLRHGETERVRLLRLAKKTAGNWHRPVHEVWNITGAVATLTVPLQHTPHHNVAQFLSDINTYSTINAKYLRQSGRGASWWTIVLYPTTKFFHNYILRKGFLDGMPGLLVALMMSFHSFLTRAKLWQLSHERS